MKLLLPVNSGQNDYMWWRGLICALFDDRAMHAYKINWSEDSEDVLDFQAPRARNPALLEQFEHMNSSIDQLTNTGDKGGDFTEHRQVKSRESLPSPGKKRE